MFDTDLEKLQDLFGHYVCGKGYDTTTNEVENLISIVNFVVCGEPMTEEAAAYIAEGLDPAVPAYRCQHCGLIGGH